MPTKTIKIYTCDLCGRETNDEDNEYKDWIHWSQDDKFEERKWNEVYLCVNCILDIGKAIEQKKLKTNKNI